MPATSNYAAGFETNQVQVSYAVESVWGELPPVQFKELRYTSCGFRPSKTRARPAEVRFNRDSSPAITNQVSAAGPLGFALSYNTYDDLLGSVLGNDWSPTLAIAGVAGDISAAAAGNRLTSTTVGKFTDIRVGQWIRTLGFTTPGNNAILYVAQKPDNQTLALTGAVLANETPAGAAAQIRGSQLVNGTLFQSLIMQQRFSSTYWRRFSGGYPPRFTLSGGVGKFLDGSFDFLFKEGLRATTSASTGPILPSPTGSVHDSVGAFGGTYLDGVRFPAKVMNFALNVSNEGAAAQYAMGDSAAAGMQPGTHLTTGNLNVFFNGETELQDRFENEEYSSLAFVTKDITGNAYVLTMPAANIMNPDTPVPGPGQTVMAQYELEGNPHPTLGSTLTIDRLPAV